MYFVYAFMILLMYLYGINKVRNFSGTVAGFKNMYTLKKLPNFFINQMTSYHIRNFRHSLYCILYKQICIMICYFSSVGLAGFTVQLR